MLTLLTIKNVALIDQLSIEFGKGLNLLTGETGSGKSIIVDSLGALTGQRVSADLIKGGSTTATIEGLFAVPTSSDLHALLDESGIDTETNDVLELIVRRELSSIGKNRVFINNQLVTQGLLKRLGPFLVDIHGQGEQASLYDTETHRLMLDRFAGTYDQLEKVASAYKKLVAVRGEISSLEKDESQKLQVIDILRFQVEEIRKANLRSSEEAELEEEKHRLNNIEKLTSLAFEAFALLYDNPESTSATLDRSARKIDELAEFDQRFSDYREGLTSAKAVIEDLAMTVRDFRKNLEFSPDRLNEIENRLAEISRLKRKYGGSVDAAIDHLKVSEERLANIETAELRKEELDREYLEMLSAYKQISRDLHDRRTSAAGKFEKAVVRDLQDVALDKARFEVRIRALENEAQFTDAGYDDIEFYFSANPGEELKPLAKVVSGGEASRLMLILKTTGGSEQSRTSVFDEIDIGIGGRVAEAVGRKLKDLAASQQVFCVTHQPQIASLADRHFLVEKEMSGSRTVVYARELDANERVEEIARMLAGETVTDAARENAKAMLASS